MRKVSGTFLRNGATLLLAISLLSCNYNKVKSQPGKGEDFSQEKMKNPDFAVVMGAVIQPKCLSCHNSSSGRSNFENYANVSRHTQAIVFRALEKRDMPPGKPLSDKEAQLLDRWIQNGSPEKVIGIGQKPGEDIASGPNDWKKIRDRIFAPKCLACHQAPNPEGGIELTDVKVVRTNILKILGSVFGDGVKPASMPPAGVETVTPGEREVLLKWFNLGMSE